jgi:IclR family transcriptional regulator, KDG regulon repressor
MLEMSATSPQYRVKAVYDALAILELLILEGRPLRVSELCHKSGESRNRTFRLLRTLEECRYVTTDVGSTAYRPTLKLFTLGLQVSNLKSLESVARPIMERLAKSVNETVYLASRDEDEVVCLITIESNQLLRINAQPGNRWPLGRGAAGQALLLATPLNEQERYLACHPSYLDQWPAVIDHYERTGVTLVDGRNGAITDQDVIAIGCPVRNALGVAEYALCITWPVTRYPTDLTYLITELQDTVRELQGELGTH